MWNSACKSLLLGVDKAEVAQHVPDAFILRRSPQLTIIACHEEQL